MQNFPKIPKITLLAPADHLKNTNTTHEEKTTCFLLYFTLSPRPGRMSGTHGIWVPKNHGKTLFLNSFSNG